MKKLLFLCLIFFNTFIYAQILGREVMRGQILGDSIAIENVTIFNKTSNKGAISDISGFFSLLAKTNDTLIFSNVAFTSRALILNEVDFQVKIVKVVLKTKVNELDEIVVSPYSLTGDLLKDDKNLKVTFIKQDLNNNQIIKKVDNPDFYSKMNNIAMPSDGTIKYGFDFVKVGKLLKNSIFGADTDTNKQFNAAQYYQDKIVPEIIKEKFSYTFFHETLELKDEEIGLFLSYCENDARIKSLLSSKDEFYLIDFLIEKNIEFKKIAKKQ
jgi:hypothetical protein